MSDDPEDASQLVVLMLGDEEYGLPIGFVPSSPTTRA